MSHLILDAVFIGIIIVLVIIGFKRGAVKIVLSFAALIFAAYLAYYFAAPAAAFINNNYVLPSITDDVISSVNNGGTLTDALPEFIIESSSKIGINLENFTIVANANKNDVYVFLDTNISPIIVSLLSSIFTVLFFIVFSVILNLLVKIINKLIKVSFVGGINSFLGAIFGALNGCVIVFLLCFAISIIIKYNILPFNITQETFDSSYFYKIFNIIF